VTGSDIAQLVVIALAMLGAGVLALRHQAQRRRKQ
jgi:hypothetical protein